MKKKSRPYKINTRMKYIFHCLLPARLNDVPSQFTVVPGVFIVHFFGFSVCVFCRCLFAVMVVLAVAEAEAEAEAKAVDTHRLVFCSRIYFYRRTSGIEGGNTISNPNKYSFTLVYLGPT